MEVDPLGAMWEENGTFFNEVHGDPIMTAETTKEWSTWRENIAVRMFNEWKASRQETWSDCC